MGHEVERDGDDRRERLRARLAMANSRVLPVEDTESSGVSARPLTVRTPKLVSAAATATGSTLIRLPRATPETDLAIDDLLEAIDDDSVLGEPAVVWQESAAEARRKLWGSAPDRPESAASPSPIVPPEAVVSDAVESSPVLMPPPVVAVVATEAPVAPMPPPVLMVDTHAAAEPLSAAPVAAQLLPPPTATPPMVVEPDPILVPVFLPEVGGPSSAEPSRPSDVAVVESSPAPAAVVPALLLPAAVVPARAQTRAPLVPVADVLDFTKTSKKKAKVKQHRTTKRHPIRQFLGFVIVLGLLGGAGYAGWYKYLRKAATWSSDLQPAAEFVEKALHRTFDKTVPVITLDPAAYEAKLVAHVLGQLYANPVVGTDLGTGAAAAVGLAAGPIPNSYALRAVGLVGADPPASVGGILAAHTTSFYSGNDHTIYRVDGTTAMFQIDMLRSLAAALIDQAVDTTATFARVSDASRTGLRGIVDGVANIAVAAKYKEEPTLKPSREHELQTRLAALPDSATPIYLFPYLSSYEVGGFGYGAAEVDKPLAGLVTPVDDGALFDPIRVPSVAVDGATTSPSARALGMEFWFDALTPTLGAEAARQAALLWIGDTSNPSELDGQACISSTISTADATSQAALLAVMTQWVATRPATSLASAAAAGTNGVTISMCSAIDVVEAVPTADATQMADFFLRADTERVVLGRAVQLGLPATPAARSCAVTAYRNGSINNDDPTSADSETVAQITDVVKFCSAAA